MNRTHFGQIKRKLNCFSARRVVGALWARCRCVVGALSARYRRIVGALSACCHVTV